MEHIPVVSAVHASTIANAIVSPDGKLTESVCQDEYNMSSASGIANIVGALYNGRTSELYESFTNSEFQDIKLTEFKSLAEEAANARPMKYGARIGNTMEFADCRVISGGDFRFTEKRIGEHIEILIWHKTNKDDRVTIDGITLEQVQSKFMQEFHFVQTIQPPVPKPELTNKQKIEADLIILYTRAGYRSPGAAYYHLLDIFDLYEQNPTVDFEQAENMDLGTIARSDVEQYREGIFSYSRALVAQATAEDNPNLQLYMNFHQFVTALTGNIGG